MGTITNNIQLDLFDHDQYTAQQNHFSNTQDDNQEHYVTIENSDDESDSQLDDSQQIDGANFDTMFPHKNESLQPAGSTISTIISMECASTDISINSFSKCVSTDVSTDISTEDVSTNVSKDVSTIISTEVIVLRASLQNFLL